MTETEKKLSWQTVIPRETVRGIAASLACVMVTSFIIDMSPWGLTRFCGIVLDFDNLGSIRLKSNDNLRWLALLALIRGLRFSFCVFIGQLFGLVWKHRYSQTVRSGSAFVFALLLFSVTAYPSLTFSGLLGLNLKLPNSSGNQFLVLLAQSGCLAVITAAVCICLDNKYLAIRRRLKRLALVMAVAALAEVANICLVARFVTGQWNLHDAAIMVAHAVTIIICTDLVRRLFSCGGAVQPGSRP